MKTRRSFLAALTAVSLTPALAYAKTERYGKFRGLRRHETTGRVKVTDKTVSFAPEFTFDRAPDPVIGFGKDGKYDKDTFMGELKSKKGAQSYAIPAGVQASAYNEVYVWCRFARVPMGVAVLT